MYKLVTVAENDPDVQIPKSVTLGGFNDMPTPFRPISTDEYIHRSSSHSPQAILYRQIHLPEWKTMRQAYIDIYHTFCLARVYPGDWQGNKTPGEYHIRYKEPMLYFYLGCEHKFKELSQQECRERKIMHGGMCNHVYECTICKTLEAHDSSD
jgi:hypothetical protein